ncbi:guanylate kinase [Desulfotomaculum copahuensis]|uniref:Guanylate kinase n=1 Tax=Desulfotomaculum copahuensis TaxID=1838280 RepID=A0A1B7LEB8_9FIRM|nr:guanylate kinase [Desulfotomaculum copahuensis]
MLLVLSGPSGAGKGTICRMLLQEEPRLQLSVSATTRPPRAREVDGVDYFFVSRERFEQMMAQDELLEWAGVYDYYYGTPRAAVDDALSRGTDVLLEIDVQGGLQIKEKIPDAVLLFVLPPSREILAARLRGRASDAPEEIARRLQWAEREVRMLSRYDYVVQNDRLEDAVSVIRSILTAERCRPGRARWYQGW